MQDYLFFTRVHMLHEDDVIFNKADTFMPHHSDPFAEVRPPAGMHARAI